MKRREFIVRFSSASAALPSLWPLALFAQNQAAPDQPTTNQPSANPGSAPQAGDDSVGQVATVGGTATVKRGDAVAVALKVADPIFVNDTLRTEADSTLGVTFDDETTFSLSANTMIVVDKFLYATDGKDNEASIHIASGTAAFVASFVAKTGDLRITTDTVALGVRGTTGVVDVPEAGAAPANPPIIKLYSDADGHVGQIQVFDYQGAEIGTLTRGASAFAIRPTGGGRFTAVAYQISTQEAARDRGILQRLIASHDIGRQMAIRRQQLRGPNRPHPNNLRPQGGERNERGGPNNENKENKNNKDNKGRRGQDNERRGQQNPGRNPGGQPRFNAPRGGAIAPPRAAPKFNGPKPRL